MSGSLRGLIGTGTGGSLREGVKGAEPKGRWRRSSGTESRILRGCICFGIFCGGASDFAALFFGGKGKSGGRLKKLTLSGGSSSREGGLSDRESPDADAPGEGAARGGDGGSGLSGGGSAGAAGEAVSDGDAGVFGGRLSVGAPGASIPGGAGESTGEGLMVWVAGDWV